MRVTVREHLHVNIEGIEDDELTAFLAMVRGAGIEERRVWMPVVKTVENTPWNKIPYSGDILLAEQVREMRNLQKAYFKTRSNDALKASIAQERKVDEMINDILNQL